MSIAEYNTILLGLVGMLFFALTGIVGWVGARIFRKLDNIEKSISGLNIKVAKQEGKNETE